MYKKKKDYPLKEMVNLLEIDQETKKLIHAPTLKIFILIKISECV